MRSWARRRGHEAEGEHLSAWIPKPRFATRGIRYRRLSAKPTRIQHPESRPVRRGREICLRWFLWNRLSEDTGAVVFEELKATRRKTCPFPTEPILRDDFRELPDTPPLWVKPSVVVEVEYRQLLKNGLRHAALKGLRPEKKPRLIRRSPLRDRGAFCRFCYGF